jgi:hypothetical protein
MKYDAIYEQCQKASQVELFLHFSSFVSLIITILVLLGHGFTDMFFLIFALGTVVIYALSRLTNLLIEIFSAIGRIEERLNEEKQMLKTDAEEKA